MGLEDLEDEAPLQLIAVQLGLLLPQRTQVLGQPLVVLKTLLLQILQELVRLASIILIAEAGQLHSHGSVPEPELIGQSMKTANYLGWGWVIVVYLKVLVGCYWADAGGVGGDQLALVVIGEEELDGEN